jgi:hypothetical protein
VKCRNGIYVFAVLFDEDEGLGQNLESTYVYSTAPYFGEEPNETVLRDDLVPYRQLFIL